ncbi:MAG TPA: hypothetical protein VN512_02150 [Clostridia bacterium]|nr:hypothetical protein [Clostridia bacterium]
MLMIVKDKKTRAILLIVAAALLAAAAFLYFASGNGALKAVCEEVNAFGYAFLPDDWYTAGGQADTSIEALAGSEDLSEAVAASKAAGFPSDTEKRGEVVLLLGQLANDDVVTVYIVNGEIELCFVQTLGGDVFSLGGES